MADKGWTWKWQRCGRYKYQKVLVRSTNSYHLVPSVARGSGGFLRVAARYAAGRKRCSTTSGGFSAPCATRPRRTKGCPFGHREGGWVIHFPAVVCTNSPSTTSSLVACAAYPVSSDGCRTVSFPDSV
jgi:hypothetical protein